MIQSISRVESISQVESISYGDAEGPFLGTAAVDLLGLTSLLIALDSTTLGLNLAGYDTTEILVGLIQGRAGPAPTHRSAGMTTCW